MARMAAVRNAYASDAVVTTPERLITMLYDRLCRDLVSAEAAIERRDRAIAHDVLVHAQEIVFELLSALDVDAWEGGPGLASIYDFLHVQLIRANIKRDAATTESCLLLVEDLCATWRQAALAASQVA